MILTIRNKIYLFLPSTGTDLSSNTGIAETAVIPDKYFDYFSPIDLHIFYTLMLNYTPTHSSTDDRHRGQLVVRFLAQGYFDMRTEGASDQTAILLVGRQLLYHLSQSCSWFRVYSYTKTELVNVTNDIQIESYKGLVPVFVLLNLIAAFDTIHHHIILQRLEHLNSIKETAFQIDFSSCRITIYALNTQKLVTVFYKVLWMEQFYLPYICFL